AATPDLAGTGVSPQVIALLKGVTQAMFASRVKAAILVVLTAGLVAAGMGLAAARSGPTAQAPVPAPAPPAPARPQRPRPPPARLGAPLPAEALARLGTVRFRHGDTIRSLAFTPDGREIVSHGEDGIRIWDAATGREVRSVLRAADGWISGAALTRHGQAIVS